MFSSPVLTRDGRQLPSHGSQICRFIETNVRLGRGDYYGQPFRLTSYHRRWIYRLYEYFPETGRRRYKQAWFGTAKGNAKTPFEAGIGAAELAGPLAKVDPLILVSAASLGQSDLVFGDLKIGVTHDDSPLKPFIDPYELSIQLMDRPDGTKRPGEAKRVAAALGSNDGPRATALLADEVHEWLGRLGDVFDVLDGAIGKRVDAFTCGISTAGFDRHSLLGRKYEYGRKVASGEVVDDGFLFEWYEIPDFVEVPERIVTDADEEQWERAVLWANPALAEADFLDWSYIRSRFDGAQAIERFKWLRYHGNQWTQAEASWLPPAAWDLRKVEGPPPPSGAEVVLAMSGAYDNDSAGIVGCRADGSLFVVEGWEEPSAGVGIDRGAVEAKLAWAMGNWRVRRLVGNPHGWRDDIDRWARTYGQRVVVVFDWLHQLRHRADACDKFYTAVVSTGGLSHDGNPMLARHLENAAQRETEEGSYIVRKGRDGPDISLAVAAVMAFDHRGAVKAGGRVW